MTLTLFFCRYWESIQVSDDLLPYVAAGDSESGAPSFSDMYNSLQAHILARSDLVVARAALVRSLFHAVLGVPSALVTYDAEGHALIPRSARLEDTSVGGADLSFSIVCLSLAL